MSGFVRIMSNRHGKLLEAILSRPHGWLFRIFLTWIFMREDKITTHWLPGHKKRMRCITRVRLVDVTPRNSIKPARFGFPRDQHRWVHPGKLSRRIIPDSPWCIRRTRFQSPCWSVCWTTYSKHARVFPPRLRVQEEGRCRDREKERSDVIIM